MESVTRSWNLRPATSDLGVPAIRPVDGSTRRFRLAGNSVGVPSRSSSSQRYGGWPPNNLGCELEPLGRFQFRELVVVAVDEDVRRRGAPARGVAVTSSDGSDS